MIAALRSTSCWIGRLRRSTAVTVHAATALAGQVLAVDGANADAEDLLADRARAESGR